eukprot:gene7004-8351_t
MASNASVVDSRRDEKTSSCDMSPKSPHHFLLQTAVALVAACSTQLTPLPALAVSGAVSGAPAPSPAVVSGAPAPSPAVVSGAPRVIDGDTLQIGDARIRLYGVDAPESKQLCQDRQKKSYECGKIAGEKLAEKIGKNSVSCEVKNKDQYGRTVAVCRLGKEDLNEWLVKTGNAVAYQEFSKDYIAAETAARGAGKGVWQGEFQIPKEWRKDQKAAPNKPVTIDHPKGCDIKGNINSKGEKIFHVKGGQYYEATQIDKSGERWFCNDKEAVSAGWRASQR